MQHISIFLPLAGGLPIYLLLPPLLLAAWRLAVNAASKKHYQHCENLRPCTFVALLPRRLRHQPGLQVQRLHRKTLWAAFGPQASFKFFSSGCGALRRKWFGSELDAVSVQEAAAAASDLRACASVSVICVTPTGR